MRTQILALLSSTAPVTLGNIQATVKDEAGKKPKMEALATELAQMVQDGLVAVIGGGYVLAPEKPAVAPVPTAQVAQSHGGGRPRRDKETPQLIVWGSMVELAKVLGSRPFSVGHLWQGCDNVGGNVIEVPHNKTEDRGGRGTLVSGFIGSGAKVVLQDCYNAFISAENAGLIAKVPTTDRKKLYTFTQKMLDSLTIMSVEQVASAPETAQEEEVAAPPEEGQAPVAGDNGDMTA